MSDSVSDDIRVAVYLSEVERELVAAGVRDRVEILEGITEHIQVELTTSDGLDVEELLERIGTPFAIATSALGNEPTRGPSMSGKVWLTLFLLAVGGFVFGIGWCAGVTLLWSSSIWTRRQKLLGTLVVPGGVAAVWAWFVLTTTPSGCEVAMRGTRVIFRRCISPVFPEPFRIAIGALLVAAEISTLVYLLRSAQARTRT